MSGTILVFVTLLAVSYGQTNVSQCLRNPGELPVKVKLSDCLTPPCGLPQLKDATLDVEFIAPRNISVMTSMATAYASIIAIPYDLGKDAATCNSLEGATCPVTKGQDLRYHLKLFVHSFFPVGITTTIEFSIVDQNMKPVICLRVPVVIVAPPSVLTPSTSDAKISVSQVAPVASFNPPVDKVSPMTVPTAAQVSKALTVAGVGGAHKN